MEKILLKKLEEICLVFRPMLNAARKQNVTGIGMFLSIGITLNTMKRCVEGGESLPNMVLEDFNWVKSISVRAFEETMFDNLIWEINSLLGNQS